MHLLWPKSGVAGVMRRVIIDALSATKIQSW
jgi:hypothetical protein